MYLFNFTLNPTPKVELRIIVEECIRRKVDSIIKGFIWSTYDSMDRSCVFVVNR